MNLRYLKTEETVQLNFLLVGQVVDNQDPDGLGRVKIKVAGLLEPSSVWARPIGRMYGVKKGIHWVPEKETNGVLWFNQGHVDHPYFLPGPWGAPGGVSDLPEQAGDGDPNKFVFRWDDFYVLVDGTPNSEKVVLEDLGSHTRFEVDRSTGNFTRVVTGAQGDEIQTVKRNLTTTVQTGNELHTVTAGSRTTSIGTDDAKTTGGDETKTIGGGRTETIAGAESKTVGLASSEIVGLAKSIVATLGVSFTAGLAMVLTAGGAISITGAGVTIQSSGPGAMIAAGLQTNQFLGGILDTVVGAIVRNVTGAVTETVSGLWTMIVTGGLLIQGVAIQIGTGSNGGYKKLLTDILIDFLNNHTHPDPVSGNTGKPNQQIVSGGTSPNYDLDKATTSDLTAS